MRMRTIDQAAAHIRELDADTAITKTALRRLITTGELKSVRIGAKYLVALETVEEFLLNGNAASVEIDRR